MIQHIWEQFLNIVRDEIGSRVVETWFRAVLLQQWDPLHKKIYLQTPNVFVRDWIKSNYHFIVQSHLCRLLHVDGIDIVYQAGKKETLPVTTNVILPQVIKQKEELPAKFRVAHKTTISDAYTFHTFVVGPSNSLAYAAAQAVAERPGQMYNPLFFYGGSGLGKTHLLHAIGNAIKESHRSAIILYQTADRFVNEYINAIRFDKVHKFQDKYKSVDVLLIDDIQFISNKEQTQEAFFHIFNTLYDAHKQIVFSSDTFPQAIHGIAKRLQSRLAGGLVADLQMPNFETKIAILKKKAEFNNHVLDDDVAQYIASLPFASIRELEGALIRVIAFCSLSQQPMTNTIVRTILAPHQSPQEKHPILFDQIMKSIAKHYSYTLHELRSKSRNKDLSFARQITMFFLKKMTGKSFRDIGLFLGGRDHSTVMHACQKIEEKAQHHDELSHKIQQIEYDILHSH